MICNFSSRYKTGGMLVLFFLCFSLGFSQGTEDFSNIPADASNYATRVWIGTNGRTWTAEKARTDQTINGRALAFTDVPNATLTTIIPGGIGDLTLTTKRIFAGTSGIITVSIGGTIVGSFPYGTSVETTTISGLNIPGNVVLVLQTDGSNKVAIDDLIWTAGENTPPVITNIQRDIHYVTPSDQVFVSADISDNDGIAFAQLRWGTTSGSLSNSIVMTNNGSGNNYSTVTAIPPHELGTIIYYVVEATDSNVVPLTSTSTEENYVVMDDMGIDDNDMLNSIRLFPNPLNAESFYIHVPKLNGEHVQINITDLAGRQVFNNSLNVDDNKITVSMNNNLNSGVYLVSLNFKGATRTYRLVKLQ